MRGGKGGGGVGREGGNEAVGVSPLKTLTSVKQSHGGFPREHCGQAGSRQTPSSLLSAGGGDTCARTTVTLTFFSWLALNPRASPPESDERGRGGEAGREPS